MVLPTADRWNTWIHLLLLCGGNVGDSPIVAVEDDVAVLSAEYRQDGTTVENLQKVMIWPSSSSSPPRPCKHGRHPPSFLSSFAFFLLVYTW
jgi:hypothetical protein